jgi:hypothetical protein
LGFKKRWILAGLGRGRTEEFGVEEILSRLGAGERTNQDVGLGEELFEGFRVGRFVVGLGESA